jgi:hypothetical protein
MGRLSVVVGGIWLVVVIVVIFMDVLLMFCFVFRTAGTVILRVTGQSPIELG